MTKKQLEQLKQHVKDMVESEYDVVRWIDDDHCVVHYWDDDNGDYYIEEEVKDLLNSMYIEE